MQKIVDLLNSRRFYVAIAAAIVTFLGEAFGIDEETATQFVHVLIAWIVGDSLRNTGA